MHEQSHTHTHVIAERQRDRHTQTDGQRKEKDVYMYPTVLFVVQIKWSSILLKGFLRKQLRHIEY